MLLEDANPKSSIDGSEVFLKVLLVGGLLISLVPPLLLVYGMMTTGFIPRPFEDLLSTASENALLTKLASLAVTVTPFLLAKACFAGDGALSPTGRACVAIALLGVALSIWASLYLTVPPLDEDQLQVVSGLVSHGFSVSVFFICALLGFKTLLN